MKPYIAFRNGKWTVLNDRINGSGRSYSQFFQAWEFVRSLNNLPASMRVRMRRSENVSLNGLDMKIISFDDCPKNLLQIVSNEK